MIQQNNTRNITLLCFLSLSLTHYLNGCKSNPSPNQHHTTQNKRFTHHTHVYLHHPKKTHSMKWSDWMSTTCKVDKDYKTKTNELCIVFVCVDACRCLRVLHSFFHFELFAILRFYVRTMYVLLTSVHTPSSTKTHQQRQQVHQLSSQ